MNERIAELVCMWDCILLMTGISYGMRMINVYYFKKHLPSEIWTQWEM